MLTEQIRSQMLVDELQLGQRLNNDIQSQNHADFNLMLAMLSHDMTDHPLHHDKVESAKEEDLRAKFSLPREQRKYAHQDDFERSSDMAQLINKDSFRQVFLLQCIQGEPLVPFERTYSPEVFAQLTPLKQEKLRQQNAGLSLKYEKIKETGDGFGVLEEIGASKRLESVSV